MDDEFNVFLNFEEFLKDLSNLWKFRSFIEEFKTIIDYWKNDLYNSKVLDFIALNERKINKLKIEIDEDENSSNLPKIYNKSLGLSEPFFSEESISIEGEIEILKLLKKMKNDRIVDYIENVNIEFSRIFKLQLPLKMIDVHFDFR